MPKDALFWQAPPYPANRRPVLPTDALSSVGKAIRRSMGALEATLSGENSWSVWALGSRMWGVGLGCRVQGAGYGVKGVGSRVYDEGLRLGGRERTSWPVVAQSP